ncbi:MAG: glycosyltransferase family 39 protein [Myxococcales bacterium]|nr:glycosyltransferase family 39 protein [Myxococcales bacterium]
MSTVFVCLTTAVSAAPVRGKLTGSAEAWGPASIEAYASRDLTLAPVATARVGPDGTFDLDVDPARATHVQLALWPDTGAPYPWLLHALAVPVPSDGLTLAVPTPPGQRDERQGRTTGGWLWSGALLLALLALVVALDRLLRRRESPLPATTSLPSLSPLWPLLAPSPLWALLATLPAALVVGWAAGMFLEPFDLLEHTYFQEAFSGDSPWAVATAPVVAERAHAPGFAILLWLVKELGGETASGLGPGGWDELLFRVPAMVAHVLGTWLTARLAARLTGSRALTVLAGLATGLAPLALRYSRDATPYSLVMALSIASTGLIALAWHSGDRRTWLAWSATAALGFLTHYFTLFVFAGQALALFILVVVGRRDGVTLARARRALLPLALFGAVLLLWGPELVRAFRMSAEDNQATRAVYPLAPSFFAFVLEHVRVVFGLPTGWEGAAAIPSLALAVGAVRWLRRDRAVALLLLVPLVLIFGLLAVSYGLHVKNFGGRVYFGYRWLAGYVPLFALVLLGLGLPSSTAETPGRLTLAGRAVAAALILGLATSGAAGTFEPQRPAQDRAASRIRLAARSGDGVAVLPAPFYSVGLAFYLHDRDRKYVHQGPSNWSYWGRGPNSLRLYGPIRSYGLPIETLARQPSLERLWVVTLRERLFGHAEFEDAVSDETLAALDVTWQRQRRLTLPFLELSLYTRRQQEPAPTWTTGITIDSTRLYRSLAWLPRGLDPDWFIDVFRGKAPIDLRLPSPPAPQFTVTITPAGAATVAPMPRDSHPGEARLQPPPVTVTAAEDAADGSTRFDVLRPDHAEVELRVTPVARARPFVVTLITQPPVH